jgi:hypothetical protein
MMQVGSSIAGPDLGPNFAAKSNPSTKYWQYSTLYAQVNQ